MAKKAAKTTATAEPKKEEAPKVSESRESAPKWTLTALCARVRKIEAALKPFGIEIDLDMDGKIGKSSIGMLVVTALVGLAVVFGAQAVERKGANWVVDDGNVYVSNATVYATTHDGNVSGTTITGSGTVQGEQLTSTDDATVTDNLDVGDDITCDVVLKRGTDGTDLHANSPLAALPSDYIVFYDDFLKGGYENTADNGSTFSETADLGMWLVSLVDSDSDADAVISVNDSAAGGWLKVETTDAAGDVVNLQLNGEAFSLTSGKELWFECKFQVEDADQNDFFIGLADTDTDVVGSLPNDHIGFKGDGDATIDITAEKDNSNTTYTVNRAVADISAYTKWLIVGFHYDGTSNIFTYVNTNDAATALMTSTQIVAGAGTVVIPDDEVLTPTISFSTEDTGKDYIEIDYIMVKQQR